MLAQRSAKIYLLPGYKKGFCPGGKRDKTNKQKNNNNKSKTKPNQKNRMNTKPSKAITLKIQLNYFIWHRLFYSFVFDYKQQQGIKDSIVLTRKKVRQ